VRSRIVRAALVAAVAVAPLPLGGCAVSLFSDHDGNEDRDERLEHLERRMDAIERALPPAPAHTSAPASPHTSAPAPAK
jgi:hypothetical protein